MKYYQVIQEAQNECFKKCEELTNELQETKAQLEKLKLSHDHHICGPGTIPEYSLLFSLFDSVHRAVTDIFLQDVFRHCPRSQILHLSITIVMISFTHPPLPTFTCARFSNTYI